MNSSLEQLVNLSKLDTQIDSYNPKIEAINAKLEEKKGSINALVEKKHEIESSITRLEALISDTNRQIAEQGEKMKKISARSSSLKKEKEIEATQTEETLGKEQLESLNEDIERNEKAVEVKKADLKELDEKINEANTELKELENETASSLKEIEDSKKELYKQKDALLAKINQKVLEFYEKIRKWAKNTAVVPMKKQACYGCFMRVNDKTFSEVVHSESITTCPHCGRILYSEINEGEIITEPVVAKKTAAKKTTTKTTAKKPTKKTADESVEE